ncbi:hypothetical protein LV84_01393 [Algoriphagus ratkowskyi]|uniref:Uncharacterized protein n=1 Tax=Algoriphagus ratkowskyi TaxID=57028 RepID=A0A2W7T804_9BACT|nr:hypothetical protein [Algoriphagus ratkowskyi]PZX59362.1 hypothetical protein LV84_01393 [Algoriphagus ratkowskyi]TXD77372.1 hypothetical protein ESW18_11225 [Algoriphagus ratkowskyi]
MRPNLHTDFILTPVSGLLKDAVTASSGIGNGIETFPLYDYVMQSVLLKLTGFQEQKMKCICWEMASVDFEYRYEFTKAPLGECSSYSEKQKIYGDLIKQIEKNGLGFAEIDINKGEILESIKIEIREIFQPSNLAIWAQRDFINHNKNFNSVASNHFANHKGTLFSDNLLKKIYENRLYKQRNRIAHNTYSYQQNLPTLRTLIEDDYKYDNYFTYFSLLMLIDKIFVGLYIKYLEVTE